mgnify:CR=1 FL=1
MKNLKHKYPSDSFDEEKYPDGINTCLEAINAIDDFWAKELPEGQLTYEQWMILKEYLLKNAVW